MISFMAFSQIDIFRNVYNEYFSIAKPSGTAYRDNFLDHRTDFFIRYLYLYFRLFNKIYFNRGVFITFGIPPLAPTPHDIGNDKPFNLFFKKNVFHL